jgi:Cof subfamily protein (haloacid dehalogenase superfamily)
MNNPYLIAIDLDGTLLKNDKTVSLRTKNALQKAMALGHKVCIATGRPYLSSLPYYQELKLTTPIVNFNGALVHHPHDKGFGVYHSPLDLPTAQEIIRTCEEFAAQNIMAEVLDDAYIRESDQVAEFILGGKKSIRTGNLLEILRENPTSILVHPQAHNAEELRDALQKKHAEVIEQRSWGAPWNIIEIIRYGLHKAVGLQRIAAYFRIPPERIIAFGDEDNDMEMIQYAGHGVAMGNAIEKLKQIADHVTATNEEDGIAEYLEKVLDL